MRFLGYSDFRYSTTSRFSGRDRRFGHPIHWSESYSVTLDHNNGIQEGGVQSTDETSSQHPEARAKENY